MTAIGQFPDWKDLTSAVSAAKLPPATAPTWTDFGPANSPQMQQLVFAVNDYVTMEPFHVNHDIVPDNCRAFIHVHWSTDGTDTGNVKWEFSILRALGHQQASFDTVTTIEVEAAHMGTQWGHNVTETTTPIILTEPDELILVALKRVAASSDENTDDVFGLTVDFHYESDREGTVSRLPDFYERSD